MTSELRAFEDKDNVGNSAKYLTGEKCIEGCGRPAGTYWSPLWCFECNVERMKRIGRSLEEIGRRFDEMSEEGKT